MATVSSEDKRQKVGIKEHSEPTQLLSPEPLPSIPLQMSAGDFENVFLLICRRLETDSENDFEESVL